MPATPIALRRLELGQERADVRARRGELRPRRRVGAEEALSDPDAADVEARREGDFPRLRVHEFGRAAPDVDDEDVVERGPAGGDAPDHHRGLFGPGEQLRGEPVAPLDLAEECLAVLRVADSARRDRERSLGAERLPVPADTR